jgi:hypothetical protein
MEVQGEEKTMNETKSTLRPWHYKKDGFKITIGNESTRHDYLEHDRTVAIIEDNSFQAEADAAFIVRAVNAHDVLLGALSEIVDHATKYGAAPLSAVKMFDRARAAIAKAEGEA